MYDRCLTCHSPLDFHGISVKPEWLRWMFCRVDQTFFACNEFGTVLASAKSVPKEAYFVQFREGKSK